MAKRSKSKKRSGGIKRRWLLNNILMITVIMAVLLFIIGVVLNRYYYNQVSGNLQLRADTQAKYMNTYTTSSYESFYEYSKLAVQNFADADKLEMQVLDEYGKVMFSSAGLSMGYLPGTDEVRTVMAEGGTKTYIGFDAGIDDTVIATTSAIYRGGDRIIGGVRYVSSARNLRSELRTIYFELFAAGFIIIFIMIVTNTVFLRSIVNPILRINELTRKIAAGQLGAKLDVEFNDEIGELCDTVNDMSQELRRMGNVKNDFISSVSHELRTPLTAINGWTETIESSIDDPETARMGLGIIKKETARLSQMVEELLDFSRMESGGMKLQTENFDLCGELYDAVLTYGELLTKAKLKVNYDEPTAPITVFGDRNRIKQVFLNVLDNAAKYGNSGGRLDISAVKKGGKCIVSIRDYGQGIPPEELPHVKEKFFKGNARGRGTGIGLAVCSEIIRLHGGTLDIMSENGEGTLVVITVPAVQEK